MKYASLPVETWTGLPCTDFAFFFCPDWEENLLSMTIPHPVPRYQFAKSHIHSNCPFEQKNPSKESIEPRE